MNDSPDYPVCLRIAGRPVLVAGGGAVAEGRVCGLVVARARVSVVSPGLTDGLRGMVSRGGAEHFARGVSEADVDGKALVLACTDDPAVNADVARWARTRGIWVNAADDPPHCDFTLPSVLRRGDIVVAVSTNGQSPGFSADLRRRLEIHVDESEAAALEIVKDYRARLRPLVQNLEERFAAVNAIVALGLPQIIRERGAQAARAEADRVFLEMTSNG